MVDNRISKVFVSSVAALLLLSSVVFLAGTQADASDDLQILDVFEPDGTPPPRENIEYDYIVKWRNIGDDDYTAKVVLYEPATNGDCSTSSIADETDEFTMSPGENGDVTLSITFGQTGEVCITAAVNEGGSDYGAYEFYVSVEPETGEADLYVLLDMESEQAAPGQDITVVFEYGNDGDVSTQTPITIMAWFDATGESDDGPYTIAPSPLTFSYITPDPDGDEIPPERMEWQYTVPSVEDGLYKLKVEIDSESNNTEDPDASNNVDSLDLCVGDCSQPDLRVKDLGPETLTSVPIEPVAGTIVSFTYTIENVGEGEARGTPSNPLVMFLEVMKCPDEDCSGQNWVKVNESREIRPSIPGNGGEFNDVSFLRLNWSTSPQDSGFWNVRVFVDGFNSIEETNETNNQAFDSSWFRVKSGYLELREQRPDLIVANIDEGDETVYDNEVTTIEVAVTQSDLADSVAEEVKVYLRVEDPEGGAVDWFQIDQAKTVGLNGETTFFEYDWTPTKLGSYAVSAYVDKNDDILEWNENNNEFEDRVITVYEKLPDLQITSVDISPVNEEGYAVVGVSSELTATIANLGVRNMTDSEGTKLEVTFYTSSPFTSKLATINVDKALDMGETTDVSIPFTFLENAAYRFIIKVDESQEIAEGTGGPELNNEAIKNAYAVSSVDAYVSDMSVDVGDGLAGKECPITFEVGVANIPEGSSYRLHFNVSVDGTFGWGEVLGVAIQNSTGFYPLGTGYSVSGQYGFIDFNSSYSNQTIVIPWIPNKDRTDTYNVSVSVSSSINVNENNDLAFVNKLSIAKLTTNIVVDAIKVTESDGSATIKVTVGYPQGEQSELDVDVAMHVYKATDYEDGNPPVDTLTVKAIEGLIRGDSRAVSFTWAVKDGNYIFVAILDPEDLIKEVDEADNTFPSKEQTFGASNVANLDEEEDDGGLLPAPSLLAALVIFSMVALIRRRI
ncbi:MAG: CARDB domain-containing protein [Candidatus Thermoplasmatota archaeon]|nr:CARDB domain-containing protein [Candidatus Thermoplasmatota archaeon]